AGGYEVARLPGVVAEVGEDQRACPAARRVVEAVPPGIAKAEIPDLRQYAVLTNVRVIAGHEIATRIIVVHPDIEPQHLAEECRRILRAVIRVAVAAAVAKRDPQH